jgi:hypothetical protein
LGTLSALVVNAIRSSPSRFFNATWNWLILVSSSKSRSAYAFASRLLWATWVRRLRVSR